MSITIDIEKLTKVSKDLIKDASNVYQESEVVIYKNADGIILTLCAYSESSAEFHDLEAGDFVCMEES